MDVPRLQSLFLNRRPIPETRDLRRVLVIGGGEASIRFARDLVADAFDVTVLGNHREGGLPDGVSAAPGDSVIAISGFAGGFEVEFHAPNGPVTEIFGSVVAAPDVDREPRFTDYGLTPSDRITALSDLEALLVADREPPAKSGSWYHAAFLIGLAGESDPAEFDRILAAIEALERIESIQPLQCYVFTRNVKVAGSDLERRYRDRRKAGTLFFKFDAAAPEVEGSADRAILRFTDPVAGVDLELTPDLLVVDERRRPDSSIELVKRAIPAIDPTSVFLQPESTRFLGVETPKAGIFAVGPARGVFPPEQTAGDYLAAKAALRRSFDDGPRRPTPGPPTVDPALCAMCLTCVRLCPHGAMSFVMQAEADPVTCVRCGVCATECPMKAIALAPTEQSPDIMTALRKRLDAIESGPKIAAFLCSRSAAQAMESARLDDRDSLAAVVVPCAGSVDIEHILEAFLHGADGALVAGCHTGNCASVYGTTLARERAAEARRFLEETGRDPDRLMFTTLASNTPTDFADALRRLRERIESGHVTEEAQ